MNVAAAHRAVNESLIMIATPMADQVRSIVDDAVLRRDAGPIRLEGYRWSGLIGTALLGLADAVEHEPREQS